MKSPRNYTGISGQLLFASALYNRGYNALVPIVDGGIGDDLVVTGDMINKPLRLQIRGKKLTWNNRKEIGSCAFKVPSLAIVEDGPMDYFGLCIFDDVQRFLGLFPSSILNQCVKTKSPIPAKGYNSGTKTEYDLRVSSDEECSRFYIANGGKKSDRIEVSNCFLHIGSEWDKVFPKHKGF